MFQLAHPVAVTCLQALCTCGSSCSRDPTAVRSGTATGPQSASKIQSSLHGTECCLSSALLPAGTLLILQQWLQMHLASACATALMKGPSPSGPAATTCPQLQTYLPANIAAQQGGLNFRYSLLLSTVWQDGRSSLSQTLSSTQLVLASQH